MALTNANAVCVCVQGAELTQGAKPGGSEKVRVQEKCMHGVRGSVKKYLSMPHIYHICIVPM